MMIRISSLGLCLALMGAPPTGAQVKNYKPVTEQCSRSKPGRLAVYSRTYDAWRDSRLKQINEQNVSGLRVAWVQGLQDGVTKTIPIVLPWTRPTVI
jgi:glucose dehydrogenase